ncbi:hypothetical protein HGA13_30060 [Nocardia speluncae]|uniref:Uncharacterized protein n=1 Tax=Nocardia speluncae TaxID=419477 RepID=A0A846XS14_9NOCA|nr:hypothetical protein [Nocardia speluncae]NKY37283.1 hypothetical protein [Nocardia speluncae]
MDHTVETRNTSEYSPQTKVGNIDRPGSQLPSDWKCWSVSALSLLTLILLFQPWLAASGPHGDVQADAFGRLDGTVPAFRGVGERLTEGVVSISGLWGISAAAAAVITLAAACMYRVFGIGLPAMVAAGAANAVLVPAALLHLNGKAPELGAMTDQHDELKTVLGDLLGTLFGGGRESGADTAQVATAVLTNQALACGLAAVLAAAIALSMRKSIRPITGTVAVPVEVAAQDPAAGRPVGARHAAPASVAVLEHELDLALPYTPGALAAVRTDHDDLGVGNRLLTRAELPRRTDGPARRDRPTARRARPRPTNRAAATPQPGSGAAASAKRAAGHCASPRSGRPVVSA